jgi:hypothetical protein
VKQLPISFQPCYHVLATLITWHQISHYWNQHK